MRAADARNPTTVTRQSVFPGTSTGAVLAIAFRMSGALTPMFIARMGPSGSPFYQ